MQPSGASGRHSSSTWLSPARAASWVAVRCGAVQVGERPRWGVAPASRNALAKARAIHPDRVTWRLHATVYRLPTQSPLLCRSDTVLCHRPRVCRLSESRATYSCSRLHRLTSAGHPLLNTPLSTTRRAYARHVALSLHAVVGLAQVAHPFATQKYHQLRGRVT